MIFDELNEDIIGAMDKRGRGFVVWNCWRDCVGGKDSDKNEQEKPCETQWKSSNGRWFIWSCWIDGGNEDIVDQVEER